MSDATEASVTKGKRPVNGGGTGPGYALGMIGALVFYWRRADDGPERLKAVGKAIVWPAFVVHGLLAHLERERAAVD